MQRISCLLRNRSVIRLHGKDTRDFLQGFTTNDVHSCAVGQGQFTSFLTPKSRIVSEGIIYSIDDGDLYFDCSSQVKKNLMKMLNIYKLKKDVTISDVSDRFVQIQNIGGQLDVESIISIPDPRSDVLGSRLVVPKECLKVASSEFTPDVVYHERRYSEGISEGEECRDEIPLEVLFHKLNGISFGKGCYTGQELIARTYFRGQVTKTLALVGISPTLEDKPSKSVFEKVSMSNKRTEKSAGKLLGGVWNEEYAEGRGLALLKLDKDIAVQEQLFEEGGYQIRIMKTFEYTK